MGFLIHREGRKILLGWLLVFLLIDASLYFMFPKSIVSLIAFIITGIIFALMLNFFRKPHRIYKGERIGSVNAPTDGQIVVIEKVFEKDYLKTECIQVSIFMTIFNAHANWVPVSGKVTTCVHEPGRFLAAYLPKSSTENERSSIVIETPDGHKILTRQIAGAVARRIVTYLKQGETYTIGDPLGFIKFGSRMDIYLPLDSEILVKMGDKVKSNRTIIASLPKRTNENSIFSNKKILSSNL